MLLSLSFLGISAKDKLRHFRALYGYSQKVGKKTYDQQGLIRELGGKRIEGGVILIEPSAFPVLRTYLEEHSISFKMHEVGGL